ncbi:TIGR02450 family Trp-rich protein [Shewanella maritima]|uniref:TIGR02450 family Trp-rich protein n=1 Tax=Shewanella maritima TaxID=2520507 RepID=A0A411PJF6_9GAMM|nr:TIGR02450 family Trp-rich protein [Shewanella maritima]QBF83618.1 TIGR02450 family Trp-rich protein [Shewanella maritima]
MNPVHPKKLLNSKWTASKPVNKLKHFSVCQVEYDEDQKVSLCILRAEYNAEELAIDWRQLKDPTLWRQGWV